MTAFLEFKRSDVARQKCQNLNGDLATVQSTLERNCANAALNKVRTCTCCNSWGSYTCAPVSGTGWCWCSTWVGLAGTNFSNGRFQSWTWYTPSSDTTSSSIAWKSLYPQQYYASYRVLYHPENGEFLNVPDYTYPYLCQQYYPPGKLKTLEMMYRSCLLRRFSTGCTTLACKPIVNAAKQIFFYRS